jgi:hypothetical protein
MQQLGPSPVLQSVRAVRSASKLSFFQIFNDSLPYSIFATVGLIRYHTKRQETIWQQHLPNLFDIAVRSRLRRPTSSCPSRNRPNQLKMLYRVSALSPQAARTISTVFGAILLALKQSIIATCFSLLDSLKVWFYCAALNKNVP